MNKNSFLALLKSNIINRVLIKFKKTMSESNAPPTTHKAQGGKGVLITTPALDQLSRLCKEQGSGKLLRVGVRSGGCSGMSYTMDFVSDDDIQKDDEVYEYSVGTSSFKVICDPKSLLYIYGMQLDFSTDLIGGGFNFTNPNASQTCGCGTSFAV